MFTCLRHWTVSRSNYNNGTIHLCSTSNHIFHIVGVTWTIYMGIMTIGRLILYMRSIDGNTSLLLFRGVINLIKRLYALCARKTLLSQHFRNCSRQSRLTVVNMTNRTDVYMRFTPVKMFFCHNSKCLYTFNSLIFNIEPVPRLELGTSSLPRKCSTAELHRHYPLKNDTFTPSPRKKLSPSLDGKLSNEWSSLV